MIVTDNFIAAGPFGSYCCKEDGGVQFERTPRIGRDIGGLNYPFHAIATDKQAADFEFR